MSASDGAALILLVALIRNNNEKIYMWFYAGRANVDDTWLFSLFVSNFSGSVDESKRKQDNEQQQQNSRNNNNNEYCCLCMHLHHSSFCFALCLI